MQERKDMSLSVRQAWVKDQSRRSLGELLNSLGVSFLTYKIGT